MAHYRCYFLGPDGRIKEVEDIHCGTDEEAIEIGRRLLTERADRDALELWNGARRVHGEPRPPTAGGD